MRLTSLSTGSVKVSRFVFCVVALAQSHSGIAATDSDGEATTPQWSVTQARQYIIEKHVLRPKPAQVPDKRAALESWLLNLDLHAAIQPRSKPAEESLGLLSIRDGDETVVVPLSGGPAWSSGLRSAIRLIDKSALARNTIVGHQLDDGKYIEQLLTPASIRVGVVETDSLAGWPTMRVTGFESGITARSARYKLKKQKLTVDARSDSGVDATGPDGHWMLDLRYCAGGDVYEATDFGGLWMKERVNWVTIKNVGQTSMALETGGRGLSVPPPIAVLVSRYTASACEQLIMGLKQYTQVLVLGEKTAGKCSVQTTTPLKGGYWLRITTGLWSGPDEVQCKAGGVVPDLLFTGNLHNRDEVEGWLGKVLQKLQGPASQ